jgi:hypothetical protein
MCGSALRVVDLRDPLRREVPVQCRENRRALLALTVPFSDQ